MSRRLNEIKDSLNFQVQDAINTAIPKKVLPSIQSTLDTQAGANFTVVDRGSHGLQESPKQVVSPWWTGGPTGYKRTQGQLFSPWWTGGPTGYKRTQGRLISPWWTGPGPTGYKRAQG